MNDIIRVSSVGPVRTVREAAPSTTTGGSAVAAQLPLFRHRLYTKSPLRNPGRLLREMYRDLLASRENWRGGYSCATYAQYRNSLLGYVLVFMPAAVASLPFVFLNAQGVIKIADTPLPYGAFAMLGTMIWQVFVDALNSPLRAVVGAQFMLIRINFPGRRPSCCRG